MSDIKKIPQNLRVFVFVNNVPKRQIPKMGGYFFNAKQKTQIIENKMYRSVFNTRQ